MPTCAIPERIVTTAKSCAGFSLDGIGQKRPASRDLSGGAVRQTHHVREIERLTATDRHHHHLADQRGLWPQRPDSDDGTRTNLLFTMSYRTGGWPKPAANFVS